MQVKSKTRVEQIDEQIAALNTEKGKLFEQHREIQEKIVTGNCLKYKTGTGFSYYRVVGFKEGEPIIKWVQLSPSSTSPLVISGVVSVINNVSDMELISEEEFAIGVEEAIELMRNALCG